MKKTHEKLMQSMLERKKTLLVLESNRSLEKMTETEPSRGDAMDIAGMNTEKEMNIAMRLRSSQEIKLIDKAIDKMRRGIYGVCEECEEPIEAKRLKAKPYVLYCLECQEEMEKSEE